MSIAQMRDKRNALAKEVRNLLDNHKESWTAEHTTQYDAKMKDIENLDAAIDREQRLLDATAEKKFKDAGVRELDPAASAQVAARAAFNKLLRNGERGMTEEDWTALRNTMSTTTATEGGYTVQTDVASSIIDALKAYGGMRRVATVIRTAQGNPMTWPTSDGTAEEGEIIAENTTANDADITFGTKALPVYKFSSKVVTVPIELLQDSSVDIEAFIRKRLADRLGRITNRMFTTGTGTNQPTGLITAATVGKIGTTGQTGTVIYDDLVDLQESVDEAYHLDGRMSFTMAQSTRKVIRKIKDSSGRPIFVPGYEQGNPKGAPDELLGAPIVINPDVPAMAANAKSISYGDHGYYTIRDVMDMTLFRFTDSAYAKKGQVGFLAWMRAGGNFMDVGGAVKLYQNSAT